MARYLSDEWYALNVELGSSLPAYDGGDLVLNYEVAGAPEGKVRYQQVIADGRVVQTEPGKHPEPDCEVSWKYADAVRVVSGEMAEDVAFMQGRLKIDGAYEKIVFELRPLFAGEAWRGFQDALRKQTVF